MHRNCDSNHKDVTLLQAVDHLYSYAAVLTRNLSEAENLVQETYARAIKSMKPPQVSSNVKLSLFAILREYG